jgi:hypothetical protein
VMNFTHKLVLLLLAFAGVVTLAALTSCSPEEGSVGPISLVCELNREPHTRAQGLRYADFLYQGAMWYLINKDGKWATYTPYPGEICFTEGD